MNILVQFIYLRSLIKQTSILEEEIEEIYANYNVYRNKFTFKQLDVKSMN